MVTETLLQEPPQTAQSKETHVHRMLREQGIAFETRTVPPELGGGVQLVLRQVSAESRALSESLQRDFQRAKADALQAAARR